MLDANIFVEKLITAEFSHICVVPCSFTKGLINASINKSGRIEYIPCASEAVACSVAAGLSVTGKKPILVVQSSGLTNTGSCITSLLIPYGIRFPILVSWRPYLKGDCEIQHAHLATYLTDLVESYGYSYSILSDDGEDNAIKQLTDCEVQSKICLIRKNTFSEAVLESENRLNLSKYNQRSRYLEILNNRMNEFDILFVGTTGNTSREMYKFMPDTNNFYMAGNMGGALSFGLGAAKGGKKVVICGGDAEFVMHMGGLTTAGRYNDLNIDLTYIVFDNESNKSTGGQKTYQDHMDYIGIAVNCGLNAHTESVDDLSIFEEIIENIKYQKGVKFIHVKCSYDLDATRPPLETICRNSI